MSEFFFRLMGGVVKAGRWLVVGVVICSMSSGGCNLLANRMVKPQAEENFGWFRDLRLPDENNEFFGVSNKARQIERNCGIGGR